MVVRKAKIIRTLTGLIGFLLLLSATGGTGKEILPLAGAGLALMWLAGRGRKRYGREKTHEYPRINFHAKI